MIPVDIGLPPVQEPRDGGMVRVAIFKLDTGWWTGIEMLIPPSTVEDNTPAGCVAVENVDRPGCQRYVDGEVIEAVPPAPDPPEDYEWAADRCQWVQSAAVVVRMARQSAAKKSITDAEVASLRAMREWIVAGGSLDALDRLKEIDERIVESRKKLNE